MRPTVSALLIVICAVQTVAARAPQITERLQQVVRPVTELVLKDNSLAAELSRLVARNDATGRIATLVRLEKQKGISDLVRVVEDGYIPTLTAMENMIAQLENVADLKGVDAEVIRLAYSDAVMAGIAKALSDGTIVAIDAGVASDVAEDMQLFVMVTLAEAMQEHADGIGALVVELARILSDTTTQNLELQGATAVDGQAASYERQVVKAVAAVVGRYTSGLSFKWMARPIDTEIRASKFNSRAAADDNGLPVQQVVDHYHQKQASTQQQRAVYQAMIDSLDAISSSVQWRSFPLKVPEIKKELRKLGFIRYGYSNGKHPIMVTANGNRLRVPASGSIKDGNQTKDLLKQARSIRFREELENWQVVDGSWQDKRQTLLDHIASVSELDKQDEKYAQKLKNLERALKDMQTYIYIHDSR